MALRYFSMSMYPRKTWALTSRPWSRLMSTEANQPGKDGPIDETVLKAGKYKPTNMERKYLVWTGKYKTLAEVPAYVTFDQMERARNWIRIYGTSIMMVFTLIGSYVMIRSGRNAKARGESLSKTNIEWHKSHKEIPSEK
uniref:Uncharacterized protein n=1 Tax=Strigamia maritima TaxID=126957 RepID=T1JK73_STRMM